jgi:hypothetical protein
MLIFDFGIVGSEEFAPTRRYIYLRVGAKGRLIRSWYIYQERVGFSRIHRFRCQRHDARRIHSLFANRECRIEP